MPAYVTPGPLPTPVRTSATAAFDAINGNSCVYCIVQQLFVGFLSRNSTLFAIDWRVCVRVLELEIASFSTMHMFSTLFLTELAVSVLKLFISKSIFSIFNVL